MSRTEFSPNDPAYVNDPYPFYRRLRDEAPVFEDPETGYWFLSRHRDIDDAVADFASFSSAQGNTVVDSRTRVGKTLGTIDPPRHDALRRIIQRGFGPARVNGMLEGVRKRTRLVWDRIDHRRSCDFVDSVSRPILFETLGEMLGLDAKAAVQASELTSELFHQDTGPYGAVLQPAQFDAVMQLLRQQLETRRADRGDDLFSVLLDAMDQGAALDEPLIVANMSTVLLAGNASIGHFLPNIIHALWANPVQYRSLREDLSLIPAVIEETLRWDTSTQCFARQTTREVNLEGGRIPADARVILLFGSANRDERVIPDPDQFLPSRKRTRHFGFGMGPHLCAGAFVARSMLKAILEELIPLLNEFELDLKKSTRVRHVMVRGFSSLHLTW